MPLNPDWLKTVDDGITNKSWDEYDSLIKSQVGDCICSPADMGYNARFVESFESNYSCVNWQIIKAMLWVESGGPLNPAWKTRPMQIGNPSDRAYEVLKQGSEGSRLIMSDGLYGEIKRNSINEPKLNIKAGIAYLFTRMVRTDFKDVFDENDTNIYLETVRQGDSLLSIATRVGTTVDTLKKFRNNSSSTVIRVGDKLQYRKAANKRAIVGWRDWNFATIADRYNGGGDADYSAKLSYVYKLFDKLVRIGN